MSWSRGDDDEDDDDDCSSAVHGNFIAVVVEEGTERKAAIVPRHGAEKDSDDDATKSHEELEIHFRILISGTKDRRHVNPWETERRLDARTAELSRGFV